MEKLKAKVIQTKDGQALLLPAEFQTNRKELLVEKNDDVFVFWPEDDYWLPFKQVAGTFPEDFMEDREQPMLNVSK